MLLEHLSYCVHYPADDIHIVVFQFMMSVVGEFFDFVALKLR